MVILNTGDKLTSEMIIKALSTTLGLLNKLVPEARFEGSSNVITGNNHPEIIPLWLMEKNAIENAINHCQGNVPKAAALLEVSPSTLYRKKQSW